MLSMTVKVIKLPDSIDTYFVHRAGKELRRATNEMAAGNLSRILNAVAEILTDISREFACTCAQEYAERNLRDPDCVQHSVAVDTADSAGELARTAMSLVEDINSRNKAQAVHPSSQQDVKEPMPDAVALLQSIVRERNKKHLTLFVSPPAQS